MKFEKEHVSSEEWVVYYSDEGKIPLATIRSFIQMLFIIMFCIAFAGYTQLSTLESVKILESYAEKYYLCSFTGVGAGVQIDCGTNNEINFTNINI